MFYRTFLLSIVIILTSALHAKAQQADVIQPEVKSPKNAIYLELFGSGFVYTLNYERAISDNLHLRIGGGYIGWQGLNDSGLKIFSIPVLMNKLYGKKNAKLELGAGFVITNSDLNLGKDRDTGRDSNFRLSLNNFAITSTVSFRYEFKNNRIFRIGLNPQYQFGNTGLLTGFAATPGISFGSGF